MSCSTILGQFGSITLSRTTVTRST